jgi:hypothetical protein
VIYTMHCKIFDLDKIYGSLKINRKHVDKVIICADKKQVVILVEETSRAKIDDVEKIEETADEIRNNNKLQNALGINPGECNIFFGIIHATREVHPMIGKRLGASRKYGIYGFSVNCNKELESKKNELLRLLI